jgi:hypothetical protein
MKKILLASLFASTVFASYMGSTQTTVTGSGLGNVVSINGDTSALQLISGSNNISTSTAGGTTTINGTLLAPKANPTFTGTIGTPLTASRTLVTDGSGNLAASSVTSTVLGYLDVGSSLTTLLSGKQDSDTQLTSLAGLSYAGNGSKVVRVNAGETDFELAAASGGIGGSTGATDNAVLRADGALGATAQNSTLVIDDNGAMTNTLTGGTAAPLVLSNGTASAPIFTLKDNTTTKWSMADGGNITQTQTGTITGNNFTNYIDNSITGQTAAFTLDGAGNWSQFIYTSGTNNTTNAGNGGVLAEVRNGYRNLAVSGIVDGSIASGKSIGVYGFATGNNSPSTYLGGYFEIASTTSGYTAAMPSGYVAALAANNLTTTGDIIQAYDGGTLAFAVKDGGIVQLGATSTTPKHIVNSDTYTAAADALTLANGPTGKAGDPAGYLKVTINGTDRAIPFW